MPPLVIFGLLGLAIWEALKLRHPAQDMAAASLDPPPAPFSDAPVFQNPSATVMAQAENGLPPVGPPMSSADDSDAAQMALDIQSDLETNGANYNRQMLASFQRKVRLTVDGLYGGRTMGALAYYLPPNQAPYPALYNPLSMVPYAPPS